MSIKNYNGEKQMETRGRLKKEKRFNQDPKISNFLRNFQQKLIMGMILNYDSKTPKVRLKDELLLTCRVDQELYVKIQETAKKITGDYIAMEDLIMHLLTYFCYIYNDDAPKCILPYEHKYPGKRKRKLWLFQRRFERFYSNRVRNFKE
jgi:hypothetical protein